MSFNFVPAELSTIERDIWSQLLAGAQNSGSAFNTVTLGTQTASGPTLRTLILRDVLPGDKTLICFTDIRSGKVNEIRQHAATSWLFWDESSRQQFQLKGESTIHTHEEWVDAYWKGTHPGNRKNYLTQQPPGTPLPEPSANLPDDWADREITREESEQGRPNFAVIRCQITRIDWLQLNKSGNRRARFEYRLATLADARWIVP